MHIHDNDGKLDNHLPLGKGDIDFKKFVNKLKEDNYNDYFSIELDTFNEEKMEKEERKEAIAYISNLMRS